MDLSWWIVYIGIPLVGTLFAVDFYIHKNAADEREKAIAEKDAQIEALRSDKKAEVDALHARINSVNKEFSDYKVNAAMLFSTTAAVREVKQELAASMGDMKRELVQGLTYIGERLDRLTERQDKR